MATKELQQPTTDYKLLRLSASLLFIGELLSLLVGLLHPDKELANNHAAVFAEYANSTSWAAVHLGQFVGMAVIIAGLLTLYSAFNIRVGMAAWIGRLGAVSAAIALGLYGLLQAVDGVALKQTVDAWVSAPDAEKMARFAAAEAIRWLEWGSRSYQSLMFGSSLIMFAFMIVWIGKIPKAIGYLMALSGVAYLAQSWIVGSEGFSPVNSLPALLGYALFITWTFWLLGIAWRTPKLVDVQVAPI